MRVLFERLKHWLRRNKGCKQCCLTCEYYDLCKVDFAEYRFGKKRYTERQLREVYEGQENMFKNLEYAEWKQALKDNGWLTEI